MKFSLRLNISLNCNNLTKTDINQQYICINVRYIKVLKFANKARISKIKCFTVQLVKLKKSVKAFLK